MTVALECALQNRAGPDVQALQGKATEACLRAMATSGVIWPAKGG